MASLWSNGEVETKTGDAVTIAEESLERLQQYVKFVFDRKEEKASKVQGLIDKVFAVLGSLDAEAEAALPGKQRARRAAHSVSPAAPPRGIAKEGARVAICRRPPGQRLNPATPPPL